MKIEAVCYQIPSLEISNDQILEFVEFNNPDLPRETLQYFKKIISKALIKNGSSTRYFRDKSKEESALDLTLKAFREALEESQTEKGHIDLLIYCGVGRGFLEPANAYFVADAMEIKCECFDVIDACMSWVRALDLANMYLKDKKYRKIAIINAEFNAYEHGFPELLHVHTISELKYKIPGYTIGEGTTVTIVSSSDQEWRFTYKTYPEYANLCNIPLKGYKNYSSQNGKLNINEIGLFYANGPKMLEVAKNVIIPMIKETVEDRDSVKAWFPHLASLQILQEISDSLEIDERFFSESFKKYGNIVSANIPTAMRIAIDNKKIERGDRIILLVGSAGMSFSIVEFDY